MRFMKYVGACLSWRAFGLTFAVLMFFFASPSAYATANVTALHIFCQKNPTDCSDGSVPETSLLMDAQGNLFGATVEGGGVEHFGTVFEITAAGKFKVLHAFCHLCNDGEAIYGTLIMDVNGNLYGTAANGGAHAGQFSGGGTVFKLSPNKTGKKWKFSVIYSFCSKAGCADSSTPSGRLTYTGAESGALWDGVSPIFGTANGLGNGIDMGAVFELDFTPGKSKPKEKIIYAFCQKDESCPDGYEPFAGVVMDASGNLYGTTLYGGTKSQGTVFELVRQKKGYSETVLYSFCQETNCADGAHPVAGVIFDGKGNLVGTTSRGGPNFDRGVAYSIAPAGTNSQETILHNFCSDTNCNDGGTPDASLLLDSSGDLVGAASNGGTGNGGVIFKLHGATETVLYNFCLSCNEVFGPDAALIEDASGNLLGTAVGQVFNNYGAVFKLTP
jgi:uncharacterized repeat protein (TIGR03803 family)